ncbi:hypothetical protein ACL1KS_09160 [Corynebacterium striatum]
MSNTDSIIEQPIEECRQSGNYFVQAVLDKRTGESRIWVSPLFEPSHSDPFTVEEIDEFIYQLQGARDYAVENFTPVGYTLTQLDNA